MIADATLSMLARRCRFACVIGATRFERVPRSPALHPRRKKRAWQQHQPRPPPERQRRARARRRRPRQRRAPPRSPRRRSRRRRRAPPRRRPRVRAAAKKTAAKKSTAKKSTPRRDEVHGEEVDGEEEHRGEEDEGVKRARPARRRIAADPSLDRTQRDEVGEQREDFGRAETVAERRARRAGRGHRIRNAASCSSSTAFIVDSNWLRWASSAASLASTVGR